MATGTAGSERGGGGAREGRGEREGRRRGEGRKREGRGKGRGRWMGDREWKGIEDGNRTGEGRKEGEREEKGERKGMESPIFKVKLPIISPTPTEPVSAPRDTFLSDDAAPQPHYPPLRLPRRSPRRRFANAISRVASMTQAASWMPNVMATSIVIYPNGGGSGRAGYYIEAGESGDRSRENIT